MDSELPGFLVPVVIISCPGEKVIHDKMIHCGNYGGLYEEANVGTDGMYWCSILTCINIYLYIINIILYLIIV